MVIIKQILNSFLFWGGWIIIPFIMEIVPALGSVFLLIRRNLRHKKKRKEMKIYPEISLIIPVYNSADTLYALFPFVIAVGVSHRKHPHRRHKRFSGDIRIVVQ